MLNEERAQAPSLDNPQTQATQVRHLRQALLWPLRLIPANGPERAEHRRAPWQLLREMGDASPWREHFDEYNGGAGGFQERHYYEFVSFLPYVQRFLYGQGRAQRVGGDAIKGSPMRVFRRRDIAAVRVVPQPGDAPVTLQVVHVDLYFFFGVDLVLLNLEVAADNLPLPLAQELRYRFGRAYPGGWDAQGHALHCLSGVEWLDAQDRDSFLVHVAEHRAPRVSAHWEFVFAPLVNHHSAAAGELRLRQIEYYRMPMMAYVAVDDPRQLTRSDFIRLGLVTGGGETLPGSEAPLPYAEQHLTNFEQQFCYDRFWAESGAAPNTRYLCSGLSLIVVGDARSAFYRCGERGVLAQFRHQHFLLFLVGHFQKATLLMMSDQLAEALQAQVKALFHLCTQHLQIDSVDEEVKERIRDMNSYLDADALCRQANTVVRLTVMTIFGLIGTFTTGFLGMNLLAAADEPLPLRALIFVVVLLATAALTVYAIIKSKRLPDFLDVVSDERLSGWTKFKSFVGVWHPSC